MGVEVRVEGHALCGEDACDGEDDWGVCAEKHGLRLARLVEVDDEVMEKKVSTQEEAARWFRAPAGWRHLGHAVGFGIDVGEVLEQSWDHGGKLQSALSGAQWVQVVNVLPVSIVCQ